MAKILENEIVCYSHLKKQLEKINRPSVQFPLK